MMRMQHAGNAQLQDLARGIRQDVVTMAAQGFASHVGSGLSMVDILTYLYWNGLNVDPQQWECEDRDIFILSKGHGSAALYATLANAGFFPRERLSEYYADGGFLPGHPVWRCVPGVEATTGSLGHGLALAVGQAIGQKMKGSSCRTVVLLGDGECNEGSVWEAAMYASKCRIANLIAFVDCNDLQGLGLVREVSSLYPLREKWASFGWRVHEVDGHDFVEIDRAYSEAVPETDGPTVILAKTVKGKGVSFMENKLEWHYKSPSTDQLRQAIEELTS